LILVTTRNVGIVYDLVQIGIIRRCSRWIDGEADKNTLEGFSLFGMGRRSGLKRKNQLSRGGLCRFLSWQGVSLVKRRTELGTEKRVAASEIDTGRRGVHVQMVGIQEGGRGCTRRKGERQWKIRGDSNGLYFRGLERTRQMDESRIA
jgi:hypothetical protein